MQECLIERIQKLGYQSNTEGVCVGVAYMGMQAILASQTNVFDERLKRIFDYSPETLLKDITNLEELRREKEPIPSALQELEDIPAFFEGIELYFQAHLYPHLFEENNAPKTQNPKSVVHLVMPKHFDENPIVVLDSFTGAYNEKELEVNFSSLRKNLLENPNSEAVALILNSSNHTVTVGYNPKKDERYFIDANQLPTQYSKGTDLSIAKKVLTAFSKNKNAIFSTHIFTTSKNKSSIAGLDSWKTSEEWTRLHKVTQEKAKRLDSSNASWLYIASKEGDTEKVRTLLEEGENKNQARYDGITPLFIACHNNHLKVVQCLLEKKVDIHKAYNNGATPLSIACQKRHLEIAKLLLNENDLDINKANNNNETPLFMACQNGYVDVVNLLLEKKADIHKANKNGLTPLFIAYQNGHVDVVKLLLEKNTDINKTNNDGATQLFMACREGYIGIVESLLEKGANMNIPFKTTKADLMKLADKNNVTAKMKAFINNQFNPSEIFMTPFDIAFVMGHLDIAYLLKSHQYRDNNSDPAQAFTTLSSNYSKKNFIQFITLENICDNLKKINSSYNPTNTIQKNAIGDLNSSIETAYQNIIDGKDVELALNTLQVTIQRISQCVKEDHLKSSGWYARFFTNSLLTKYIDAIVPPAVPSK